MKNNNAQLTGSLFIAISAFFYGSYGVWSRLMIGHFSEFNQAWIRAAILLCILIPTGLIFHQFKKVQKKDLKWFAAISFAGGLNQAPFFFGFEHLTIGTATLLFYIMLTIGAYILGKLFFQENLTPTKYFSLALAIIGLSIIYRFSLVPSQILPALSTLLAGTLGAIFVVLSKKLSSTYSEIQILTILFISMFVSNLLISLTLHEPLPQLSLSLAWFGQFGYIASMLLANVAVIIGFRHIEPSIGGLIGLLEVIFAAVFGIILFHETLTPSLLIGSLIIILAASFTDIVNLVQKYLS